MIHFYIELTNRFDNYRLQNDMQTWKKVVSRKLTTKDFRTHDIYEIIRLQLINGEIELEGKKWKLNSTTSFMGDRNQLYYKVFAERDTFPLTPSKEQLISVIENGDDRRSNSLILNTHGFFELRFRETINLMIADPTIIFRNETFDAENDYVGTKAALDEEFIEELYADVLEDWLQHLKKGTTNMYCDTKTKKTSKQLLTEIEKEKRVFEKRKKDEEE